MEEHSNQADKKNYKRCLHNNHAVDLSSMKLVAKDFNQIRMQIKKFNVFNFCKYFSINISFAEIGNFTVLQKTINGNPDIIKSFNKFISRLKNIY